MLMQAIDSYLQLRRAGGYQLRDTEVLLKEFACFAAERGEIRIKAETAIAWASRATSLHQRARRLNSLILFARYIRAEDADHQVRRAGFLVIPRVHAPYLTSSHRPKSPRSSRKASNSHRQDL
jgi:integrase/recombinase XerD